jgi:aminopeptidase N
MKNIILGVFLLFSFAGFSQKQDSVQSEAYIKIYRASATKINDLVHTKLEVSFDYSKSWMYGKAWITLHPHFYATDSLNLEAKGMSIIEVSIIKKNTRIPLKYINNGRNLLITLDKTYSGGENYTVFIDYIAKPDDLKEKGSEAISDAKGLYFINPLGKDKNKPIQIWTQGETESNSAWFPTIDKPNQKTTDEISMTVQDKYQTMSNGILASSKKNINGTRTDTWKMNLPHAPYLMMMAVGKYSIIKDSYKGKEVSYYVEKEYAPVARKIFGLTPEMIGYFSQITGVDYPWPKYAQITARDYVSGAMENTTATLHGDDAQQDARQLIDQNKWEEVIAHELFHQWFGDYVTTKSWSNLSVNESFADFSETLWCEHKHGKDAGDEHNYTAMQDYLQRSEDEKKDLVRFYYGHRDDMFDAVSYMKGGRILNMLKNYVGDDAFFKSLNLFLTTKKFQAAEVQDLRLAFEEVTGQDLNWFWNQWFYGSGHPKLDISYDYNPDSKTAKVIIHQLQTDKIFRFQIAVDVYQGAKKRRYKVWVDQKEDTLSFPVNSKPDLINVDGDKILLCDKNDHKTLDNFIFQYQNAGLYVDRREAIDYAAKKQVGDSNALALLKTAMKDRYSGLRIYAIQMLKTGNDTVKHAIEPLLADMAKNDPETLVRAEAIEALGKYKKNSYKELFIKSMNDSSYSIAGNSLLALGAIDSVAALYWAKKNSVQHFNALSLAISKTFYMYSSEIEFDSLSLLFNNAPTYMAKLSLLDSFANYLKRVKNTANFKKGIDMIVSYPEEIPEALRKFVLPYINGPILNGIAADKQVSGMVEQADYVNSKLPAKPKATAIVEIYSDSLLKYTGEYDNNLETFKVVLNDDKTLDLCTTNGAKMELIALSKDKFFIKDRNAYSLEFSSNDKGEIIKMILLFSGGQMKELKKK